MLGSKKKWIFSYSLTTFESNVPVKTPSTRRALRSLTEYAPSVRLKRLVSCGPNSFYLNKYDENKYIKLCIIE